MKSADLKTEALCWLRFGKKLDYICTEGGYWSADVLGVSEEFAIEVEVKVSIADLRAEFRNKKTKHYYYANTKGGWVPNFFYFAVPLELAEKTVEIVKELAPKAGVLAYQYPHERPGMRMRVVKRPTSLHDKKPDKRLVRAAMLRMGSELCNLHIALDKLKNAPIEQVEELKKQILEAIIQSHGAEDWDKVGAEDAAESKPSEDAVRGHGGTSPDAGGDRPLPAGDTPQSDG